MRLQLPDAPYKGLAETGTSAVFIDLTAERAARRPADQVVGDPGVGTVLTFPTTDTSADLDPIA